MYETVRRTNIISSLTDRCPCFALQTLVRIDFGLRRASDNIISRAYYPTEHISYNAKHGPLHSCIQYRYVFINYYNNNVHDLYVYSYYVYSTMSRTCIEISYLYISRYDVTRWHYHDALSSVQLFVIML